MGLLCWRSARSRGRGDARHRDAGLPDIQVEGGENLPLPGREPRHGLAYAAPPSGRRARRRWLRTTDTTGPDMA